MPSVVACPVPVLQFFDGTGNPAAGGSLLTQVGGVNFITYSDIGGVTALPNPIPLNSRGEVSTAAGVSSQLFLAANIVYTFTLYDAYGNQVWVQRYVNGVSISQASIGMALYPQTQIEKNAGVVPSFYNYPQGDIRRYGAAGDGVTDDTAAINSWLLVGGGLYAPPATYITSSQQNLAVNGTYISAYNAIIKAANGSNFESLIRAQNISDVIIEGLALDANYQGRPGLTIRAVCFNMGPVTDTQLINVRAMNAIGYIGISGFGIAVGAQSLRCQVINPIVENCGTSTYPADAIFLSGTQITCVNPTSYNCFDTGVAIESSNQSGVTGGTILNCGCICAITNAVNATASDNYIDGLTGSKWNATVTGGIQIGNPLGSSTGNLLNTRLSNITIDTGTGPGINVRQTGAALTKGLTISNVRISGATAQGILLEATDVTINDVNINGASVSNAIQLLNGSANVNINNAHIDGQFNIGIGSDTTSNVRIVNPIINGNGVDSTWAVYFANTATNCNVLLPEVAGTTTGVVGSDAGTSPITTPIPRLVGLPYSPGISFDSSSGTDFSITATNGTAFSINNPSNPSTGQEITITIRNGSGTTLGTITWGTAYKMATWTSPANGFSRSIKFIYNGSVWVESSRTTVDIPN